MSSIRPGLEAQADEHDRNRHSPAGCGPSRHRSPRGADGSGEISPAIIRGRIAHVPSNRALTDSPLWIRRIASARAGAIDRTRSLSVHFSAEIGTGVRAHDLQYILLVGTAA